ncbi:MAG: YbfB/YjiJ family MFS transporter [Campylobacterota bacterium]|nr:YbfB/YjiJ family MFS transporter [Campylobacterota bacterium]
MAGIISLIIGVGIARFAFTSLLPFMLDDYLDITTTGVLASLNFAGYLSGAIFAIFIKDINSKVFYFRIGMILCVITTLILGITTDETIWIISRIIAGFSTAMAMIVGSAIVMYKLNFKDKTKAMGIHFSGIGIAILSTDLISKFVIYLNGTWGFAWVVLSVFGLLITIYSIYILSFDKTEKQKAVKHKVNKSIFSFFVIVLTIAYFTEGVGFVVQATFLPDIINSIEGLEGYGGYTWTLVGIAAIPSTVILMRLAHKYGSVNIIMFAMFLQVIGILIPTITTNIYLNLLSGALYGGTFAGLVALFMHLGGKIAPHNPVVLMAAFTSAYGIGQVTAPLYSVALVNYTGSYSWTLYVTAGIVFSGILLLFFTQKYQNL